MIYPGITLGADDIGRHYDELDAFYREVWGDHVHHGLWLEGRETVEEAVRNLISFAVGHVKLQPGTAVCDVGCGYGATASMLATEYGCDVTGLTISGQQYRRAVREYAGESCRFLLEDWMQNSLESSSRDVVLAIESFSHMPDKARFFGEAFRVLRAGGTLIVLAWLAGPEISRSSRRHLLEPICREGRLPSMADADEIQVMARRAGFEIVYFDDLTGKVRRTWTICLGRLAGKILTDRRYRRYLLDSRSSDRRFLLTLVRIVTAYRVGAMQYGLLVAAKET